MISSYSFGEISFISPKGVASRYVSDICIDVRKWSINHWKREMNHLLCTEDLYCLLRDNPKILVIGTGIYGRMKVDKGLISYLTEREIEFQALKTNVAVKLYNDLIVNKDVIDKSIKIAACLHVTC